MLGCRYVRRSVVLPRDRAAPAPCRQRELRPQSLRFQPRAAEAEANSTRIAPLPFFVAIALSRWTLTQLDRKFNRLSCAENSCADAIANFGRAQYFPNILRVQSQFSC